MKGKWDKMKGKWDTEHTRVFLSKSNDRTKRNDKTKRNDNDTKHKVQQHKHNTEEQNTTGRKGALNIHTILTKMDCYSNIQKQYSINICYIA